MEVLQHNANHAPGIMSVPDTAMAPACPKCIIVAVADIRKFMEQQNIPSAQVIYFDTYEEARKFKEELSSESQQ